MHTPGAAIVCASSAEPAVVQFEKLAAVSSTSLRQVAAAPPPGCPLKSATAVTVRTWSYAAGTKSLKLALLFPAATTYVTPALTELQIARWSTDEPHAPSEPDPPRLMFATLIPSREALAVTQSIPQAMLDQLPEPALLRTRTA